MTTTITGGRQCSVISFLRKWAVEGNAKKIKKAYFNEIIKTFDPEIDSEAIDAAYSLYPWFIPKNYKLKWFQPAKYDKSGKLVVKK
jgi:hypothetical protein